MEIGIFLMPAHPPERTLYDATQWDLDIIELADQLGYVEAWVGEHFTVPWEPICAPDLLLAQALLRTKNIKLAPGAHLLPYHHPVELAHRVAYFDHLAQGRFMLGVGASGIPGDWALFDVDGKNGEHREMTREALEIMLRIWTEDEPWEHRGKYWNANGIAPMFEGSDEAAHQAVPEAAPADRCHRVQRRLRDAQAGRRTWLPANESWISTPNTSPRTGTRCWKGPTAAAAPRIAATGGWCARCWWPKPTNRRSATPSTA